jgi:hypothetical protein
MATAGLGAAVDALTTIAETPRSDVKSGAENEGTVLQGELPQVAHKRDRVEDCEYEANASVNY